MSDALGMAAAYAGTMAAIAKAADVSELIEILDLEIALRDALLAAHAGAAEAAVQKAEAMAVTATSGAAIAEALGPVYTKRMTAGAKRALPVAIDAIYRLAKTMAWRRSLKRDEAPALDPIDRAEIPEVAIAKAKGDKLTSVRPSFGLVDDKAIEKLTDLQLHWVGDHWGDNLQARVTEVAQAMIESGLGGDYVAKELGAVLRREFDLTPEAPFRPRAYEVPSGWAGSETVYWEGLASNAMTVARVTGSVTAMRQLRVTRLEVRNPVDQRTCKRCALLDGKVFTLQQAADQLDGLMGAQSKDDVKKVAPWLSATKLAALTSGPGHVSDDDSAALAAANVTLPPYHLLCRCTVDVAADAELGPDPDA